MTQRIIPIVQVDAFADAPFDGNPAAVMPLDAWLDDDVLQRIAAENNLSETAFYLPDATDEADFELRWFTPTDEVALCGHATLASGHVVLSEGDADRVTFRTRRSGVLSVDRDGDGYALGLPAWKPEPRDLPELAAAMGGSVEATLWHPGRYAVFVYRDADAILALEPDMAALTAAGNILYIATAPGAGSAYGSDIVSRVFAPAAGVPEDPVTGSAHCILTPYWSDRLGRESFTAWQASKRGGRIECRLAGDRAVLTGKCVTVIEGVMRV